MSNPVEERLDRPATGRILWPSEFFDVVGSTTIPIAGCEYTLAKCYKVSDRGLRTEDDQDRPKLWLRVAAGIARAFYQAYEDRLLASHGLVRAPRETILYSKFDNTALLTSGLRQRTAMVLDVLTVADWLNAAGTVAPTAGEDSQRVLVAVGGDPEWTTRTVIFTAAMAVCHDDEGFLVLVQEHLFGLGTSPRLRSSLAKFLRPFDVKTFGADNWTTEQLLVRSAVFAEKRMGDILSAADPVLYVKAAVRDKASHDRDQALGQRVDSLVSAIGEFIASQKKPF